MNKPLSSTAILIKALKLRLKKVSITRVAEIYGAKRPTIYFHLDESRADIANMDSLKRIAAAIKKAEKEQGKKAQQILQSLNQ